MSPLDGLADWPAPHVAAAVLHLPAEGPPRVTATYGPLDRPFPLASVSKLLTAAAVLVAVEEGIVGLDDAAGPEGATLRHLLAHASGLGVDGGQLARPGARRIYSNAGIEAAAARVAAAAAMPFDQYLHEAVVQPLGLAATTLAGSPAHGATSTVDDLVRFTAEVLAPTLLAPATVAEATTVAFPGLSGVLPGYGRQDPNDWGLGFEVRGTKAPHWTGSANGPATFGHFGRSGTFLWIDPAAATALVVLTDLAFGDWALGRWPALSDAVLADGRS